MPDSRIRRTGCASVVFAGLVATVVTTTPAHAEQAPGAEQGRTGKHCATVINRAGEVQFRTCSDDRAEIRAEIRAQGAQPHDWLATIADLPENGGATDDLYGSDGPCDAEGYGIANLASWVPGENWNNRISSFFTGTSNCNRVRGYDATNYGYRVGSWENPATSGVTVEWVGEGADNKIESMFLRNIG